MDKNNSDKTENIPEKRNKETVSNPYAGLSQQELIKLVQLQNSKLQDYESNIRKKEETLQEKEEILNKKDKTIAGLEKKLKQTRRITADPNLRKRIKADTIAGKEQEDIPVSIGTIFKDYVLTDVIGKGGMGAVYTAKLAVDEMLGKINQEIGHTNNKANIFEELKKQARKTNIRKVKNIAKEQEQEQSKIKRNQKLMAELGKYMNSFNLNDLDDVEDFEFAVKVMSNTAIKNITSRERFKGEIGALMRLSGIEDIVQIYDFSTEDSHPWYAMEKVKTNVKAEKLHKNPAENEKRALDVIIRAGKALQKAHEQGIIHRDLKPENILIYIENNGELKNCKITDFGLAKDTDIKETFTKTGEIFGTLNYMPPEQAKNSKDTDEKTDVYSLGATLYTFLTGLRPEQTDEQEVQAKLIAKQTKDLIKFPSEIIRIDKRLEAIILKAMARKPEQRYQSMNEFVNDIVAYIKGEEISIKNPQQEIEKRITARAGVETIIKESKKFFESKQYWRAADAVTAKIREFEEKILSKPKNADIIAKNKLVEYLEKQHIPELGKRLTEIKDYLAGADIEKYTPETIKEFLDLLFEYKIKNTEKQFKKNEFPIVVEKEKNNWSRDGPEIAECGYWTGILSTGKKTKDKFYEKSLEKRINILKRQEFGLYQAQKAIKAELAFFNDYEKILNTESKEKFLEYMKNFIENFIEIDSENGYIPIRSIMDKDKLREKNGITTDSSDIINALFNANKFDINNKYADIAKKHIDFIIKNMMRNNGSVLRYAVIDKNANIKEKEPESMKDRLSGKYPEHARMKTQAHFIKGLVNAYKHTKSEKYKKTAEKAIKFFIDNLDKDNLSFYSVNPESKIKNSASSAITADALLDFAQLTNNNKHKKNAVRLLKSLIKHKLDASLEYQGLIKGAQESLKNKSPPSYIVAEYYFISALSKLVDNDLYKPRIFKSAKTTDWNKSDYQCGFTKKDDSNAETQKQLKIINDNDNLYIRLETQDNQDIVKARITDADGSESFYTLKKQDNAYTLEKSFASLGFTKKPKSLKFNIITKNKKETTSWSPNPTDPDVYKQYVVKGDTSFGMGTLIIE